MSSCQSDDSNNSAWVAASDFTTIIPCTLSITATATDVACNAGSDGTMAVSVSGAYGNYTIAWSNGSTSSSVTSLSAGTYIVTVTDDNSCVETATVTISQPDVLAASTSISNVSCNGLSDGSIDLTVTGGATPFTYAWSTGSTDEDPTSLVADIYDVTVTDANGCTTTASATVTEPSVSTLTVFNNGTSICAGDSITLTAATGFSGHQWHDASGVISGATSSTYVVYATGSYYVIANDANSCPSTSAATAVTVDALSAPTNLSSSNLAFNSATLSWDPVAGITQYKLTYSDGSTSNSAVTSNTSVNITGLSAGSAYTWQVQSVCPLNNNIFSTAVSASFTTLSCTAPSNSVSYTHLTLPTTPYV